MYESYGYASGGGATDTFLAAYSWLILIAAWAYFGFMMYKVAHKTGNYPIAWWAFVPILNTILLIKMAAKPLWWFWLLLVPRPLSPLAVVLAWTYGFQP